jgi:hypothetical protein
MRTRFGPSPDLRSKLAGGLWRGPSIMFKEEDIVYGAVGRLSFGANTTGSSPMVLPITTQSIVRIAELRAVVQARIWRSWTDKYAPRS